MPLSPGHRIGNYEVLSPAGAGGMGEVYRARDSRLERTVAIKALPADLKDNADRRARFEQEARLVAALNHPNIAGIHGIEDAADGTETYLVLEFVEGETLAHKLARGPLPVMDAAQLATQIAAAVEAAHEKGIIHRDLKPENVMITPQAVAKVLDFGLAKDGSANADPDDGRTMGLSQAAPATADGMVLGTAPYMSPEQARGLPVDKSVDVWAFGCILMECLTGKQVFPGDTPSDVIARILEREPDWTAIPPGAPPRLVDLLRRCLTKDASLRPRDIGDIGRELRATISGSQVSGPIDAKAGSPSLAVLYFENLADDPDSEYFCAGVTEDILTDLSKIKGLRVASKSAVSRYRGREVDLDRVAVDLGVSAVLEGSVRRAGDRIRITTQLINAADGFQLWGERFDRTLEDVFAVQDEIATAIVDALRVAMSPSDLQEITRDRPDNVEAYDLYLRGREKYGLYEKETMFEALALFEEAIALEPDYALAWAGVADSYAQLIVSGWADDTDEAAKLGLNAARRSVSLDPKLPDGHKAEATILSTTCGPNEEVDRALTKALEADPRFTPALANLGILCFLRADIARAERLLRRAQEIDPQETFGPMWLAGLLFWTRRWEEALTAIDRLRPLAESDTFLSIATIFEFKIRLELGHMDEAERALESALADERINGENLLPLRAQLFARRNQAAEARELIRELAPRQNRYFMVQPSLVETALRVGEPDLAHLALRRTGSVNYVPMMLRLEPACHPMLDHEHFGPRVSPLTLVWPLQAPMIDEARFRLFNEVKIESGRPEGSDFLGVATKL